MTQPNQSNEAVPLGSVQYFDGEAYVPLANVTEAINEVDRRHARKLKEAVREARIDCLKITHGHMQTGTKLDDAYFIHNITMLEAELQKEVK